MQHWHIMLVCVYTCLLRNHLQECELSCQPYKGLHIFGILVQSCDQIQGKQYQKLASEIICMWYIYSAISLLVQSIMKSLRYSCLVLTLVLIQTPGPAYHLLRLLWVVKYHTQISQKLDGTLHMPIPLRKLLYKQQIGWL